MDSGLVVDSGFDICNVSITGKVLWIWQGWCLLSQLWKSLWPCAQERNVERPGEESSWEEHDSQSPRNIENRALWEWGKKDLYSWKENRIEAIQITVNAIIYNSAGWEEEKGRRKDWWRKHLSDGIFRWWIGGKGSRGIGVALDAWWRWWK